MANIKIDSELMYHMLPAVPVTSAKRFTAVHDESNRPLLFSISSDDRFLAIKANGQGSNVIIDLSEVLGVHQKVETFAVTQSSGASNLLFIAFSTRNASGYSDLHVLRPIKPINLDLPPDQLRGMLLLGPIQKPSKIRIIQLHMNPTNNDNPPLLVPVFYDINDDLQICRVVITPRDWAWKTDVQIPELAKGFIALSPGKLALGEGIFVLYRTGQAKPALMFITTDEPEDTTTIDLGFPSGAEPTSMNTFTNDKGLTNILISGKGLFLLTAKDCLRSGNVATTISQDPICYNAQNLYIAQAGHSIVAWFETEDHSLAYQRASNDGKLIGAPVLLLPPGSNMEYAPIIDPQSTSQILVIINDNNELSILEQSVDSLMWNTTPFLVHRREKMSEISAFVAHVEVCDVNNLPLVEKSFTLSSSAWVGALVNGVFQSIPVQGTTVETDSRGVITVVVPSEEMGSYVFTLRDRAGSSYLPAHGVVFDPSSKVVQRLSTIRSATDLRDFKTGNGARLLEGSTASDSDIKNAAAAIKDITSITYPTSQSPLAKAASHAPIVLTQIVQSSGSSFPPGLINSAKNVFYDTWQWITRQFDKVKSWFLQRINDVWQFIVVIADQAWSFIIDSVNAIAKVAGFILSMLKIAFHTLVDAFGYVFNWEDIKHTKASIQTMVNSVFDFGSAFILNHKSSVNEVFDNLEKRIHESLNVDIPDEQMNEKHSSNRTEFDKLPNKSDVSRSAPANVSAYYFEQAKNDSSELVEASDAFINAFQNVIQPKSKEMGATNATIHSDFMNLYRAKKGASVADILKILGANLLDVLLRLIRSIVTGLMDCASDVLQGIKAILNWDVQIPVITPLLEFLGVPAFSLLDAISLIIAMPITVISKVITGHSPARIDAFDCQAMVEGRLDEASMLAYNELASYLAIVGFILNTAYKVYSISTSGKTPPPKTFSLGSLVVNLVILAGTFPYDKESPGRPFRIGVWTLLSANEVIASVALQTPLPVGEALANVDIFIALSTFFLKQVVHGYEYKEKKSAASRAVTSLSVARSVYATASGMAGGYGTLAPDLIEKAICAFLVAGSNADAAALSTAISLLDKATS